MSKAFIASAWVYLPWFFCWVVLELTGLLFGPSGVIHPGFVPWYTLSEFVWSGEAQFHVKLIVLFSLAILMVHFAAPDFTL